MHYVGGIAGDSADGTISNSYNTGNVSGSSYYVGGIAGSSSSGTISNSYNTGSVSGGSSVGGIAGQSAYGTISNSYNTGSVSGSNSAGGIAGYSSGTISNSYNKGSVNGTNAAGGIAGISSSGATISNSYSAGHVSGDGYVGGFIGNAADDTIVNNSFWDINASGTEEAVGFIEAAMSCPFLYTWNGNEFIFIAELGGGGGLLYSSPWTPGGVGNPDPYNVPRRPKEVTGLDYMYLTDEQLQPENGKYTLILKEDQDEINYMDMVELYVVDHPENVKIYSPVFNGMNLWVEQDYENMLYHTIENPKPPVSAYDAQGNDVLEIISQVDGNYVEGRALEWDTLTIDLGDLSEAEQIKLLFNGYNNFASSKDYQNRFQYLIQNPEEPFYMYAYPYAEVIGEDGNWVYAPEDEQLFQAHSHPDESPSLPRTNVWDITHWFEANNYTNFTIRIHTHQDVRIGYIGVDTSLDVPINITKIKPTSAVLDDKGIASNRENPVYTDVKRSNIPVEGYFTKLGDILELVLETNDKYVVMKPGDEVVFEFDEVEKQEGMSRSYYIHQVGYYKGYGILERLGYDIVNVEPLPYHEMEYYHLNLTSPYEDDEDYQAYLDEWNTRYLGNEESIEPLMLTSLVLLKNVNFKHVLLLFFFLGLSLVSLFLNFGNYSKSLSLFFVLFFIGIIGTGFVIADAYDGIRKIF